MSNTAFDIQKDQLNVVTSRVFKATPERLWQALTDPDQIHRWWGPGIYRTDIEQNDLQVGGRWRFVQKSEDGQTHAFRGEYQEIDEPNKLVRSFEYEPMAGHILIETMLLEALDDGATRLTATAHYANVEDLEGMVGMGMEGGQRESFERLAVLTEA